MSSTAIRSNKALSSWMKEPCLSVSRSKTFRTRPMSCARSNRVERDVVIPAVDNRLFKDGRVGGDADQPVLLDQPFEAAVSDEAARQKVQPNHLAIFVQGLQRIHGFSSR